MMAALGVIVLIVVGLLLLAAEILVIPGIGLIGFLGVGVIVGAGVLAFKTLSTAWGTAALIGGLGAAGVLAWLLPRTRVGRAMVLGDAQVARASDERLAALLGAAGEAATPLRPAGAARFADRVVDVVTDGIYVDAGRRVRVVKVEGSRVVVEPVDP